MDQEPNEPFPVIGSLVTVVLWSSPYLVFLILVWAWLR